MAEDRRWNPGTSRDDERYRPSGKVIGAGIAGLVLLVFVLQNTQTTTITMLLFDVSFPLWLVLAGTIVISAAIGYVLGSRSRRR